MSRRGKTAAALSALALAGGGFAVGQATDQPGTDKVPTGCPPSIQSIGQAGCTKELPPPPGETAPPAPGVTGPQGAQPQSDGAAAPSAKLIVSSTLVSFSNGNFPLSALCKATGGVGTPPAGTLACGGSAASWNAMAVAWHNRTGVWLQSNGPASMYRSFAQQQELRNYWCSLGSCQNAAVPGTSNHGIGTAVDGSPATITAIKTIGPQYHWNIQGGCSDAPWESWHAHYCGGYSGGNPGPYGSGGGGGGGGPAPCPKHPVLKRGSRCHKAVKHAQTRLRVYNDGVTKPAADGSFGAKTKKAVKQFQASHDLGVDGVVGRKTWRRLEAAPLLFAKERGHVNRIAWDWHTGHTNGDTRRARRWCGHRANRIRNLAQDHGWDAENRLFRFRKLQHYAL